MILTVKIQESMDVYPNWKFQGHVNSHLEVSCQACRTNKPATCILKLFSDDSDLNDGVTFYLGSECYRKGELYHTFTHFETRMYNTVKDEVESTKRRIKSNRIITHDDIYDQMVETNFVHNVRHHIHTSNYFFTYSIYSCLEKSKAHL